MNAKRADGATFNDWYKMATLIEHLVLDRTGLTGSFDFELQWTADTARSAGATGDGPSIFTALQEQLELKLDAQRGPVEFLVIDSFGRPTPD